MKLKGSNSHSMMVATGLSVLSGILIVIALPGYNIFPAAFAALVPLLFVLENASLRKSLWLAFVSGLTAGLIYYTWAIESTFRYSEALSVKSIFVYGGLAVYHAMWFMLIGLAHFFAARKFQRSAWRYVLVFAAMCVCIEWTYQNIFPSYPWIIVLPYTQSNNLLLLQWTSFGGMWILTFIVAGFNALIFCAINSKQWRLAVAGTGALVVLHIGGYGILTNEQQARSSSVKVALLQENIDAESRWDDAFVDSLAHTLLTLNQEAAENNPQLILWSETAIPWTFHTEDDLLNEALRLTYQSGATHLVGMLTPVDENDHVFNSIYCIEKDGRATGRYDKAELLSFLEKPFVNWQLPFEQSRYSNVIPGKRSNVVQTRFARIGTMICNESLSPYSAAAAASHNAHMLAISSNDSWFYGSVLVHAHLALSRMRAVETRKDIALNANRGFGGFIRASGEMEIQYPSDTPRVIFGDVHLDSQQTYAAQFPDGMLFCSLVFFAIALLQHHKSFTPGKKGRL